MCKSKLKSIKWEGRDLEDIWFGIVVLFLKSSLTTLMATGRYAWMLPNLGEERTAELGVTGQKAYLASDSMRKKLWTNLPYNKIYAYIGSMFGSYASNLGFSVLVNYTCYGQTVLALKPSSSCGYIQFSWMTHSLVSVFSTHQVINWQQG